MASDPSSVVTLISRSSLLLCLAGALATLVLTWAAVRWLGPLGFLDHPGGRKRHQGAIPRVGGMALAGALLLGAVFGRGGEMLDGRGWIGVSLIAFMGVLDDRFPLRARWKASMGLGIALFLAWSQVWYFLPQPGAVSLLGFSVPPSALVVGSLLVALYWAVPQADNLIDGANGLALGCAVIVLSTLAFAGGGDPFLLGCVLALLAFNWPRAHCFLGDCGSLTLGLILALLAARTFGRTHPDAILWLFAYPVADVAMVVAIRFATGQPLGLGDRNHLHHHWGRVLGRHARFRVPLLWLTTALCCSGALLRGPWRLIPFTGLALLVGQMVRFALFSIRAHRALQSRAAQAGAVPEVPERRKASSQLPEGAWQKAFERRGGSSPL